MTETKFTPEPWFAYQNPYGTYVRYYPDGEVVASMNGDFNQHDKLKHANLIAAAPELYEALQSVVTMHDFGNGMETFIIEKARAALAKARGEV